VASAPDPDNLASEIRPASSGEVRRAGSALSTTVGCRFAPRCLLAEDRCRAETPPLFQVSAQRAAACWRLDVAAPDLLHQTHAEKEGAIKT
jgi:oligopeptide/dipeptide ABC transporter ATP-binding protein